MKRTDEKILLFPVPAYANEALFLVDDSEYLHIQRCDDGWDYTLYSKNDLAVIDGGVVDNPNLSIAAIVESLDIQDRSRIEPVSLEILDQL